MIPLSKPPRSRLEAPVKAARNIAETAARTTLELLGEGSRDQDIRHLVWEVAYEHCNLDGASAAWGSREDTPTRRELTRLHPDEASLYDDLHGTRSHRPCVWSRNASVMPGFRPFWPRMKSGRHEAGPGSPSKK